MAASLAVLVVLLADVFHDLVTRSLQARVERHGERLHVIDRIVDRHGVDHRVHAWPGPPLDGVKLFAMRRSLAIEPELVVEADRVDDERVLVLPPPDRMAEP